MKNHLIKHYKHVICDRKYKSKRYLGWLKSLFPHLDLHHIASKSVDYLLMPIDHDYHLNVVHKNKGKYFEQYLRQSVGYLCLYVKEELNQKYCLQDMTAEELKKFFEFIQGVENGTN